ncbi:tRNA(fMet)-specific endonuclease VapC [Spirosoma harenae]
MYLLDTNILIHHLNDRHGISQKIREIGFANCFISEISILELLYGVANSSLAKRVENRAKVQALENSLKGRIIPIRLAFDAFAEQKTTLRQQGLLISDFDLLIGSTALVHGYTLVSVNTKEMQRIEGLKLENWVAA